MPPFGGFPHPLSFQLHFLPLIHYNFVLRLVRLLGHPDVVIENFRVLIDMT